MYRPEEIKIIPYVRFQTPDGTFHDTMQEALAYTPPHCKPGQYAMWCCSEGEYSPTNKHFEAVLVFIFDNEAAADFEEDCGFYGSSSYGLDGPGWYAWDHSEEVWMALPDYVGENLVKK